MRVHHRGTAALTTAVLLAAGLTAAQRAQPQGPARTSGAGAAAPAAAPVAADGAGRATCRTRTAGSHAVADCHNPDPAADRVRLHVECARWWDVDADSAPADIPPAGYARLTERCWQRIAAVWITHEPVPARHPRAAHGPLTPARPPAGS
ncbi:hypothetical protein [Streptomyces tremellae]|uniref:Uncharacterized protein n=1 Tax=Streptomyces tremellae TaxID=1124239 RepID=A0ABP7FJT8_9ACTN